ncbi:hypothetical protein FBU30_003725 [Linnemannia zychae]|nr:hypothetical protein FBU30_003725 [Linnemannia zychae]
MAALASNREEETLEPLNDHLLDENTNNTNHSRATEHRISPTTVHPKRKSDSYHHYSHSQPVTKRQIRASPSSVTTSTRPLTPIAIAPSVATPLKQYALSTVSRPTAKSTPPILTPAVLPTINSTSITTPPSTTSVVVASCQPKLTKPALSVIAPAPISMSATQLDATWRATPPKAKRIAPTMTPKPVVAQPTAASSILAATASEQGPQTTISIDKSPKQQSQENEGDDEDEYDDDMDEDDEDDELVDSLLAPSERHLHSFIGHWQGWCRGRRYKDKDYITTQKIAAYVKSMISPGFQLDRLNPPLHIPAFNGESEKYLPSWTTVHMNILSIQVLYVRQCEREQKPIDMNSFMNRTGLKSLLYDYRNRFATSDPTSKLILDPRLFQPRPDGSEPLIPVESSNTSQTALFSEHTNDDNNINQKNDYEEPNNGSPKFGNSHSEITSSSPDLGNSNDSHSKPFQPNRSYKPSVPYHPSNSNPQYCMNTAIASMEMEMFMSSLRNDILAAVNQSVEHNRATQLAIEMLASRMDRMERSARQAMLDIIDPELNEEDLRDMELYHKRRALQLRQSRLERKKGKFTGAQKKTDRQRDERERQYDKQQFSNSHSRLHGRNHSDDAHQSEENYDVEDDNDGEDDQFYDILPEDEIYDNNHGYKSDPDADDANEDTVDGNPNELKPEDTLDEDTYDLLPRKNTTRRSFGGLKSTPGTPMCDLFQSKELNLLADEIAAHYKQIEGMKTEESFKEEDLLPRNAGLVQLWVEMFSAQERQPSIWGMNVYANGWHLKLEMKVKQRVTLKRKIIQSVLTKIQAEITKTTGSSTPNSKAPTLKEMVKNALIAVELDIRKDGSINAYHDRIKRRSNQ